MLNQVAFCGQNSSQKRPNHVDFNIKENTAAWNKRLQINYNFYLKSIRFLTEPYLQPVACASEVLGSHQVAAVLGLGLR